MPPERTVIRARADILISLLKMVGAALTTGYLCVASWPVEDIWKALVIATGFLGILACVFELQGNIKQLERVRIELQTAALKEQIAQSERRS